MIIEDSVKERGKVTGQGVMVRRGHLYMSGGMGGREKWGVTLKARKEGGCDAEGKEGVRKEGEIHLWGSQIVQCLVFCDTPYLLYCICREHLIHAPTLAQGVLSHTPWEVQLFSHYLNGIQTSSCQVLMLVH